MPKGDIIIDTGKLLQRNGYRIKILNTINFKKSMHYNPFAYLHSEKDILKLVTTLIANTKGEGKGGDDFWIKAETLLYTALIGYIYYEAPKEEQNFSRTCSTPRTPPMSASMTGCWKCVPPSAFREITSAGPPLRTNWHV